MYPMKTSYCELTNRDHSDIMDQENTKEIVHCIVLISQ